MVSRLRVESSSHVSHVSPSQKRPESIRRPENSRPRHTSLMRYTYLSIYYNIDDYYDILCAPQPFQHLTLLIRRRSRFHLLLPSIALVPNEVEVFERQVRGCRAPAAEGVLLNLLRATALAPTVSGSSKRLRLMPSSRRRIMKTH